MNRRVYQAVLRNDGILKQGDGVFFLLPTDCKNCFCSYFVAQRQIGAVCIRGLMPRSSYEFSVKRGYCFASYCLQEPCSHRTGGAEEGVAVE